MSRLTSECLESLKQKVNLVELLSSYMEVKRAGAYYRALCPFHEERTPSFVIQPGSSHYHCFGCQAHGDAISFLMNYQQLNFQEAVEFLADRFQVPLEYQSKGEQAPSKTHYLKALEKLHLFYQKTLQSDEGKEALHYLHERGLKTDFIESFELGLAPKSSGSFFKMIQDNELEEDTLKELGLITEANRMFFFDRITFPIRDAKGSIIGFSARVYHEGASGGKYINSKESLVFKKSHTLFGLNYCRQRIAKNKRVLIVEGQIDALQLIHAGLKATVAPLGTALTEFHVEKLLHLGVETAYLAFDSDQAGSQAAVKAGNLLQKKGITVYVVQLPQDSDPDSYLKKEGAEAFRQLLKKNQDYLSFLIQYSSKKTDLSNPANKARVVEKIALEIKKWDHPVMVHESLKTLARLTSVPESTLGLDEVIVPHVFRPKLSHQDSQLNCNEPFLETDLLTWLVQSHPKRNEYLKIALDYLTEEEFWDPTCLEIFKVLKELFSSKQELDALTLLTHFKEESSEKLFEKLIEKKIRPDTDLKLFVQSIQKLLDRHWMKKREEIKVQIQSGELSDQEALRLAKAFDHIQKNRPLVQLPCT